MVRYADNGTIDTQFGGGDGIVVVDPGAGSESVAGVVETFDGRIVVGGTIRDGESKSGFLTRYDAYGAVDTQFGGGNGTVVVDPGAGSESVAGFVETFDGRIVVAGTIRDGANGNVFLTRYDAHGAADLTFGDNGNVILDLGGGHDSASHLVLQADGKLVIAGHTDRDGTFDALLVRFNSDGTLDSRFGVGGFITSGSLDGVGIVFQQSDGGLIIAGSSGSESALARYDSDGALDTAFGGGDGVATIEIGGGESSVVDVIQQADGKLVAVGTALVVENGDYQIYWGMARYDVDGTLDSSFGSGDGVVTRAMGSLYYPTYVESVVQQTDGALVVAGHAETFWGSGYYADPGNDDVVLVSYNADGSFRHISLTGAVEFGPFDEGSDDFAQQIVRQVDGKLLVVGDFINWTVPIDAGVLLARFNADGSPDTTFCAVGDQSLFSESPFTISIPKTVFNDPDGDPLSYALTPVGGEAFPSWLNFDVSSRTLSGIPPIGAEDVTLRLTATDPLGASTSLDFTLSVIDRHVATSSNESFTAGLGEDLFVFSNGFGQDRITGFAVTEDVIDLSGVTNPDWTSFADVQAHMTQAGADTLIDIEGGNTITLVGVAAVSLTAADFQL